MSRASAESSRALRRTSLIFREDPTRDLRALDTLEAVIADGRLYTKAELDDALARQRAFFASVWFDRPSVWLAELAAHAVARRR